MQITHGAAKAVIIADDSTSRFERFCIDLLNAVEGGANIVSTSKSWDMGRDGRGVTRTGTTIFICCSLTNEVDSKSSSDIKRLKGNASKIDRVYFCSSQALSEFRCNEIEAEVRKILDKSSQVVVYGCQQLTDYAIRFADVLLSHYKSEINDVIKMLEGTTKVSGPEANSLRLALIATGGENTLTIRAEIYKASIREVLKTHDKSLGDICRDISNTFKLNRSLPEIIIKEQLNELIEIGEINVTDKKYSLTELGKSNLVAGEENAMEELLTGRNVIKNSIEILIGSELTDQHYNLIWNKLQEELAVLFYNRGQQMVEALSIIIGDGNKKTKLSKDELFFIEELSISVASVTASPDLKIQIKTAISDMFTEKNGPAFNWLLQICSAFIAICSLGLESIVGQAISHILTKLILVFDTDVVLSLLSEGEADHDSVDAIVTRWHSLGGKIFVASPVLEEVAHHAWIAQYDFDQVKSWLPGTDEDRQRFIENAYVRGFAHHIANRKARVSNWFRYIEQYRAKDKWDYSKILDLVKKEYAIELLAPRASEDEELEAKVRKFLQDKADEKGVGSIDIAYDKAKRDAQLYSAIVSNLTKFRRRDSETSCYLVSSAKRLTQLETEFHETLEEHIVITISMVLYILSLVPGVSLGLSAMKSFLFDERKYNYGSDFERTLLRVIKESSEYDMPWARRSLLIKEVKNKVLDNARRKTENKKRSTTIILSHSLKPENMAETVGLIKASLDTIAVDTKLEKENIELKKQIHQLENK